MEAFWLCGVSGEVDAAEFEGFFEGTYLKGGADEGQVMLLSDGDGEKHHQGETE